MNELLEWLRGPLGTWLSAGVIVSATSLAASTFWERRKLSRPERASAYAAFLEASSRRWKVFADRDGAVKQKDSARLEELRTLQSDARHDCYAAYTRIEILGSRRTVEAALMMLKTYDLRNKAFNSGGAVAGVGNDRRAAVINSFVRSARRDLGLKRLNGRTMKKISKQFETF